MTDPKPEEETKVEKPNLTPPEAVAAPKKRRAKKLKVVISADEVKTKRSRFSTLYPETAKVELLVEANPKKAGSKSFERFEGYTGAATIGQALANGVTYADVAYDVGRAFIKVTL